MADVTSTFANGRLRIYADGVLNLVIWTDTLISLTAWVESPSFLISLGFSSREVRLKYPYQRDLWIAILAAIDAALAGESTPAAGDNSPPGSPADETTTGRRS